MVAIFSLFLCLFVFIYFEAKYPRVRVLYSLFYVALFFLYFGREEGAEMGERGKVLMGERGKVLVGKKGGEAGVVDR
jgi:hypothetical protein